MNIKEAEALSGLGRASIRYYEQEGLISPKREPNGYRDYSDAEIDALKKIRLLRELGMTLEEIRALQSGGEELSSALSRRAAALEADERAAARAREVCREMLDRAESFASLDAGVYLGALSGSRELQPRDAAPETVARPWRRFLARSLDLSVYMLLWYLLLGPVLRVNLLERSALGFWLDGLVSLGIMLFAEPLLLRLFGTTLGKWIFGLHIEDANGARPCYADGLRRTRGVIVYGMGLSVPVAELIMLLRSRARCLRGEKLRWEGDGLVCSLRGTQPWRGLCCAAAMLAVCFATVLAGLSARFPPNRGELTVAQFAENYNSMARFYQTDTSLYMDESGQLRDDPSDESVFVELVPTVFEYEISGGYISAVRLSAGEYDEASWVELFSLNPRLMTAALAMVCAQEEFTLFSDAPYRVTSAMRYESADFTEAGIRIIYVCDLSGERSGAEFSMTKQ